MMRLLLSVVLAMVLAGNLLAPPLVGTVRACSAGPDYNPVADSDVVVAGTVLGWERADPDPTASTGSSSGFVPIRLTLRVEQRFKGSTPPEIDVVDQSSLLETAGHSGWAGRAGACGSFDADPTSTYAVMGLTRNEDGTYQAGRPRTFYLGARPPAPGFERGIARIASYDPIAVVTAGGGTALDCPVDAAACAFGSQVQRWLETETLDPVLSLLNTEEVVCPGPAPIGLGGPYPLCDGSQPGERRYGTLIVRLQSEGGIGGIDYFREALVRGASGMRLVSIGCPDVEAGAGALCGERFSLIFASPTCLMPGGCPTRPVTVVLVNREPSGQFRLPTIIFATEAVMPQQALSGGRVETGPEFLATGPVTSVTYFPWSPATISALPPAGVGPIADTTIEPVVLPLALVLAFGGVGAFAWRRQRRRRRE